jgi:hypothetical protein
MLVLLWKHITTISAQTNNTEHWHLAVSVAKEEDSLQALSRSLKSQESRDEQL